MNFVVKVVSQKTGNSVSSNKSLSQNGQNVWTEISVLKSAVHENIIDYYAAFAVIPENTSEMPAVWMLLEYADAGDLAYEIQRYSAGHIPEPGARYYMQQICDGLLHLSQPLNRPQ